jgi:hypothetical protein
MMDPDAVHTPGPRRSGRTRRPTNIPDNVYGNRASMNILDDDEEEFWGPSTSQVIKMAQDGGVKLINFLLNAAVSSADAKGKIPEVSKVHKWHFRDLMHLPKATQEE